MAVFTKAEPLSVTYGLGLEDHDHEGRVITAEYPGFYLVCCYTPNSQNELRRPGLPHDLGGRFPGLPPEPGREQARHPVCGT